MRSAERGGMALVNTHPDYMSFGDTKKARDEFPAYYYEELLSYIRQRYEGLLVRPYRETLLVFIPALPWTFCGASFQC